jgi:UDPglucose 6-dehydrogenase
MFNTVSGKKITLLGFAFKKNTGDTRETASVYVAKHLLAEHAKITIYDPEVTESQIRYDFTTEYDAVPNSSTFDDLVTVAKDPYEACKNSHCIAILTEWDEFAEYDYKKIYESMQKPAFFFDGRNVVDIEEIENIGFEAYSIGKPTKESTKMVIFIPCCPEITAPLLVGDIFSKIDERSIIFLWKGVKCFC